MLGTVSKWLREDAEAGDEARSSYTTTSMAYSAHMLHTVLVLTIHYSPLSTYLLLTIRRSFTACMMMEMRRTSTRRRRCAV